MSVGSRHHNIPTTLCNNWLVHGLCTATVVHPSHVANRLSRWIAAKSGAYRALRRFSIHYQPATARAGSLSTAWPCASFTWEKHQPFGSTTMNMNCFLFCSHQFVWVTTYNWSNRFLDLWQRNSRHPGARSNAPPGHSEVIEFPCQTEPTRAASCRWWL